MRRGVDRVLHGTRTDAEVAWIKALREVLHFVEASNSDWEHMGFFLRTLRKHGLAVPLGDAIIAYLAISTSLRCEHLIDTLH